ncbi:MAG: YegP family protein [Bacteroidia bacterium]
MKNPKFEVYKDKRGEYRFRLNAKNGQAILASEGYSSKQGCLNGINSVKTNSQDDARFDKLTAKNGQFYFNLKARNGEIIGKSEMYTSTSGRDNGINSVRSNASEAPTEEIE